MDLKMVMERLTALLLFGAFALSVLVHAQDQTGFISIDCGATADYTSNVTDINYVSDLTYRDTGVIKSIPAQLQSTYLQEYHNVRSFPNGTRNCYTVRPSRVASTKYLIRASFLYANYDSQNQVPQFDIHLGPNYWDTIEFVDATTSVFKEILYDLTSNYTNICLVNTGNGIPFISVLELRPIKNTVYLTKSGTLALFRRWDFGTTNTGRVRYQDDVYDRIWSSFSWPELDNLNTSSTIDADKKTDFQPPSLVMSTAVTPKNASDPIKFYWEPQDPTTQFYIYMYFAELEQLPANQTREFTITLNGTLWYGPMRPDYLYSTTVYSEFPKSGSRLEFWVSRTDNSTLPPLLNAMEIYTVKQFLQAPTSQVEVDAMKSIKSTYGVKKNWEGDPCAPQAYMWAGLNCSFNNYDPPKITTLNLSSSGLTGEIPSYIANLLSLTILDLSNNSLNGSLPSFLSQLPSLTVLNLSNNKLTGSVPADLIQKSKSGVLTLSVDENPTLCASTSCTKKKKSSNVVPIVASIAGAAVLIVLAALLFIWLSRKRRNQGRKVSMVMNNHLHEDESILGAKNRQFTYSEVLSITNNFEREIGKGGFGTVYRGYLDGAQVAVKMLSPSSAQGYKEFHAEVKLLMRVHHRDLVSLVGYCDDNNHRALIYEFMLNGNLEANLSERNPNVLSWEDRMRIAVDSAQGLEYLHYGCKPPIVHRDVKSTNILLSQTFQAKIADFGLSRVFPAEGGTQVSTVVAGTPGYLDPEYYVSQRLHEKSDVFSFGVVLLEIITSRPVITRNQEQGHISQWVNHILETQGDVRNIVDPRLRGDFDVNSAWKAVEIAMACVSTTSAQRPTMTQAVIDLKESLVMETARLNRSSGTVSDTSMEMASLNITTSMSPVAR